MSTEGFHVNPEDKNRVHDIAKAQQMAKAGKKTREAKITNLWGGTNSVEQRTRLAEEKEDYAGISYDAEQSMLNNSDEEIKLAVKKLEEEIRRIPFNSDYRIQDRLRAKINGLEVILKNRGMERDRAAGGIDDVAKAQAMAAAEQPHRDSMKDKEEYLDLRYRATRPVGSGLTTEDRARMEVLGKRHGEVEVRSAIDHTRSWSEKKAEEAAYLYDVEQSVADKSEADISLEIGGLKNETKKLDDILKEYRNSNFISRSDMERSGFNYDEARRQLDQMAKRRDAFVKIAEKRKVEGLSADIKKKIA